MCTLSKEPFPCVVSASASSALARADPSTLTAAAQSQDPVVHGTCLIKLPTRKAIRRVKVIFEGLCDATGGAGWPYETSSVLCKSLEHDLRGEYFEAGNHAFSFTFIIPSSTPASQRSIYGRTRYYGPSRAGSPFLLRLTHLRV